MTGESRSARLINCIARSGDPGEVSIERELVALGVERAKEGNVGLFGSGVRGGRGESSRRACIAWDRVAELIQFSSGALARGGESGISLKASAK